MLEASERAHILRRCKNDERARRAFAGWLVVDPSFSRIDLLVYLSITDTLDPERRLGRDVWTVRCWAPCRAAVRRTPRVSRSKARGRHLKRDGTDLRILSISRCRSEAYVIVYLGDLNNLTCTLGVNNEWTRLWHAVAGSLAKRLVKRSSRAYVTLLQINHTVGRAARSLDVTLYSQ